MRKRRKGLSLRGWSAALLLTWAAKLTVEGHLMSAVALLTGAIALGAWLHHRQGVRA